MINAILHIRKDLLIQLRGMRELSEEVTGGNELNQQLKNKRI